MIKCFNTNEFINSIYSLGAVRHAVAAGREHAACRRREGVALGSGQHELDPSRGPDLPGP